MINFLNTFRGRLLIILAILLIATLGVQLYLNLRTERQNAALREMQEQALVAGFALGANSLTSGDRLQEFVKREGQPFFDEKSTKRIQDIILINPDWEIYDSLSDEYLPAVGEDGEAKNLKLSEAKNLPSLMEASRLGEDAKNFPNAVLNEDETDGEAHVIPLETNQGRFYVMVILKTDRSQAVARAAQPLIYTLLLLLFSTAVTFFLVWRFTRPIANLSKAARLVAVGDLSVRVSDSARGDEMGQLAAQFNEMTAELAKNRELEAKFQEAERSAVVGRLASAIAHEIRNPLNYINLTLDHLRSKFTPEADADKQATFEKLTAQLKGEVERINRLVTDFLSYSRPMTLDLEPTNIRAVVKDSLRLVEAQAEEQNIKISLIERENVPRILGDAEFLRSAFNNLFINAVQAMESAGGILHVTISPDDNDNYVRIEIKDTGGGIPQENLAKIFEPYFSTKETGTGLGLAIVKKIIEDNNGTIDVESGLNEGTRFTVKLPKA